jgi:hypothetical protein
MNPGLACRKLGVRLDELVVEAGRAKKTFLVEDEVGRFARMGGGSIGQSLGQTAGGLDEVVGDIVVRLRRLNELMETAKSRRL